MEIPSYFHTSSTRMLAEGGQREKNVTCGTETESSDEGADGGKNFHIFKEKMKRPLREWRLVRRD